MKTPTNFIPIIGPLYADDLQANAVVVTNEIEKLKDVITFPGNVFKRIEK